MVQSNYNGSLNMSSPMYCRDSCYQFDHYYEAIVVSVDKVGSYNFRSQSDFDAYGSIYTNNFDPSYPSANLLAHDDDGGENIQFSLTVALQPQSTYILVVTTYSSHVMGKFSIMASGTSFINLTRVYSHQTTTETSKYLMCARVIASWGGSWSVLPLFISTLVIRKNASFSNTSL